MQIVLKINSVLSKRTDRLSLLRHSEANLIPDTTNSTLRFRLFLMKSPVCPHGGKHQPPHVTMILQIDDGVFW